jgi:hypothetical protein
MLLRRLLGSVVVLVAMTLPMMGQEKKDDKKEDKGSSDKATLKWKFEPGKTFYQKMFTTTTQNMKVTNNEVTQKQDQTFYFSWTPVEEKEGNWTIKQKIDGVKMDIDIGGMKINYDSTNPGAQNNPLSDFFKALVGSEFTLTLSPVSKDKDPVYKVTKIEGRTEFLNKLVNANPQMKPLLEQILSDKAMMEMADPTFAAIPNREVTKGKEGAWKKDTSLDMGPIGKYENSYVYTYEGKNSDAKTDAEKKLDKIGVETTLKYKEPGEVAGVGGLPFKIKSADLKSTSAKGTIFFDAEKGRPEKTTMSLDLKGDLSIEIGGQTTKVELTQNQKTEVETSETDLLKKKQ